MVYPEEPHPFTSSQPTSSEELKRAIQKAWDSLTIDDINGLVRTMPDWVNAVLAAKGGHILY